MIGAALASIGIPKDSILRYEKAIKSDEFLVVVHGTADEVKRAREVIVIAGNDGVQVDTHPDA